MSDQTGPGEVAPLGQNQSNAGQSQQRGGQQGRSRSLVEQLQ